MNAKRRRRTLLRWTAFALVVGALLVMLLLALAYAKKAKELRKLAPDTPVPTSNAADDLPISVTDLVPSPEITAPADLVKQSDRGEPIREPSESRDRWSQFAALADRAQELNFFSRDTEAIAVLQQALELAGVWKSNTWWEELPVQDLEPSQQEAIRRQVYRALLTLDGLCLKRMGVALGGTDDGRDPSLLVLIRRFVTTDAGTREARATIEITNRLSGYQPSEAANWYSATARYRLRTGSRLRGAELGPPLNAFDAYALAILILISHHDPSFTVWFSDYGRFMGSPDSPPLQLDVAQRLLGDALRTEPDDYWIHLALGHIQYLQGERLWKADEQQAAIESLESARVIMRRCQELRPELPFAYSDASTVTRTLADWIPKQQPLPPEAIARVPTLIRESLDEAKQGRERAPLDGWVYWHEGLAEVAAGNIDNAVECFFKASSFDSDYSLMQNSLLEKLNHVRGRGAAVEWATSLVEGAPESNDDAARTLRLRSLLAALHLSAFDYVAAVKEADRVLELAPSNPTAGEVKAWVHLKQGKPLESYSLLTTEPLRSSTSNRIGSILALARAASECSKLDDAQSHYERAIEMAQVPRHKVAASLGLAHVLIRRGEGDAALEWVLRAREIDCGCDLTHVTRFAITQWTERAKREREDMQPETESLRRMIERIAELPTTALNHILRPTPSAPHPESSKPQ